MIKINSIKIDRNTLILQLACAALIVAAYFTSRILVFISAIAAMGYIFSTAKWEQKFSLFMFLLSFSPIFKYTGVETSLFMFLRIAIVASYTMQNKEKMNFTFILLAIAFFTYCTVVSEIYRTDYLISAINLILWIMIGYVLIHTVTPENSAPVVKSLSNGILITGFVGLFLEEIPQLNEAVTVLMTIAEDGAYVSRYAGFWSDPNFFSVTIVASIWFSYCEFNKSRINVVEFLLRCAAASFLGLMTMSKSCIVLLIVFWVYVLISKNNIKTAPKVGLFFALIVAVGVFVWKNPYWFSDIMYRFVGGENDFSANTLTTGRYEIWESYFDKITEDMSWIFGNGLNKANFEHKAMHNVFIQAIYYIGVVGLVLYASLIAIAYKSVKADNVRKKTNSPAKVAIISLFATLFFLDGFLIEQYYYMFSLAFVYLLNTQSSEEGMILSEETVV